MLSDPANVFTPSADHILLPLSLPKALGEDLPTISPPACSAAEVDMSAFDENMAPSSSSLSSILKRGRDSPAKGRIDGTKVRILSVRKGAFLLFSMGAPEAFFYRGVRKMQISPPGCLPVDSFLWGMVLRWEDAGFLCVCRLPLDRTDFELLQRAVVPALVPPLRKHLTDPECNTAELCFLLHAGLVVGGLLRGRVCPWWPLGERAGARRGAEGGLHLDLGQCEPDV